MHTNLITDTTNEKMYVEQTMLSFKQKKMYNT